MKTALPTPKDVRRIYFKQQRKKNILPEHAVLTAEMNDEVRDIRTKLDAATNEVERSKVEKELYRVLDQKRMIEDRYFSEQADRLTDYILQQPDRIRLSRGSIGDREITTLNKRRPTVTLFDRYVAQILARSFGVTNRGRDHMVRNLLNALRMTTGVSTASRSIVKIDIKDFFLSVSHDILRVKLSSNSGVPRFALKHTNSILDAYSRLYDRSHGLPQGVPSSAVLSDIYLEPLDERLKQHPNVVLYLRYVDDIILISDGQSAESLVSYVDAILRELDLFRNREKSQTVVHPAVQKTTFTYLGYKFRFSAGGSQLDGVDISEAKRDRYHQAIRRLQVHGQTSVCWGNRRQVEIFLAACEYLLVPHYSNGDRDSSRIVSGLAYSSKYLLELKKNRIHFEELVKEFHQSIRPIIANVAKKDRMTHICPCCSKPVAKLAQLQGALNTHYSAHNVLTMSAKPHLDDDIRNTIRRLLWNS